MGRVIVAIVVAFAKLLRALTPMASRGQWEHREAEAGALRQDLEDADAGPRGIDQYQR